MFFFHILETLKNVGTGKKSERRHLSTSSEDSSQCCDANRYIERQTVTPPKIGRTIDTQMSQIRCDLEMKALWQEFNTLGTEMIVTKAGRYVTEFFCYEFPRPTINVFNIWMNRYMRCTWVRWLWQNGLGENLDECCQNLFQSFPPAQPPELHSL